MNRSLTFGALLLSLFSSEVSALPPHQWSLSIPNSDSAWLYSAAFDHDGNLFLVGDLRGTLQTEKGSLVSAGDDALVMSFDPSGSLRWAHLFGDADLQIALGVAADPAGNVYVTGDMQGSTDFGGGVLTSAGQRDIFLVKLDTNGNHLWSKRFGDAEDQIPLDLAVDPSGNVAITGNMLGDLTFGGPSISHCGYWNATTSTCYDGQDVFIAKFDGNGNHIWSKEIDGEYRQDVEDIAFDLLGNIILAGIYQGTLDFGGGVLPDPGTWWDIFLAKFSPAGEHVWSRAFAGTEQESVQALAVDGLGNPAIAGIFFGTASFGGSTFVNVGNVFTWDTFVASFDPDGNHRWSQHLSGWNTQQVHDLVIDASNSVHVLGQYDVDMTVGSEVVTNNGWGSPFVSTFDGSGNYAATTTFATNDNNAFGLVGAVDATGRMALAGTFYGTLNMGGATLHDTTPTQINADLFVAEYGQPVPVLISHFKASARTAAVDIEWNLLSDEAMQGFSLYRRESSEAAFNEIRRGPVRSGSDSYRDMDVQPGSTYQYELVVRSADGDEFRSQTATATVPALRTTLGANMPNPFRGDTTIQYTVGETAEISIGIYDVRGARVAVLKEGRRSAGSYAATWNGRDESGRSAGSGIYFYRFEGSRAVDAKKMILLK